MRETTLSPTSARAAYLADLEAKLHPKPQRKVRGKQGLQAMLRAAPRYPVGRLAALDDDVLVCSDLHIGHTNIIRYCERPFGNVDVMNEALWTGLFESVTPASTLVVVGDLAMGQAVGAPAGQILARLSCRARHLVLGNHDLTGAGTLRAEGFDHVWSALLSGGDPPLIWTHYPLSEVPDGYVNIHGHTHNTAPGRTPHINVSVEQLAYRPVALARLRGLAEVLIRGEYPPGATTLARLDAITDPGGNHAKRD